MQVRGKRYCGPIFQLYILLFVFGFFIGGCGFVSSLDQVTDTSSPHTMVVTVTQSNAIILSSTSLPCDQNGHFSIKYKNKSDQPLQLTIQTINQDQTEVLDEFSMAAAAGDGGVNDYQVKPETLLRLDSQKLSALLLVSVHPLSLSGMQVGMLYTLDLKKTN